MCGRINRLFIPPTLFLLSRPLEQLEFIRSSNFPAEPCFVPPTRPQRFILPHKLQSRYRRHLSHFKPLVSKSPARVDLFTNAPRLCIHPVQELQIGRIQSRKHMCETNIVALHDQIPQRKRISLPHPSFLPSRPRSKRSRKSRSSSRGTRRRHFYATQQRARVMRDVLFFF